MPTLEDLLAAIYRDENNVRIDCFWDAGWEIGLGDELNGWAGTAHADTVAEIAPALKALVVKCYPESEAARG